MGIGHRIKIVTSLALPRHLLVNGQSSERKRDIFLTFDDGPHPINTDKILNGLDKANAKASFFLLGTEVEKFPSLVRQIAASGHLVGNHGYSHINAHKMTPTAFLENIERCHKVLSNCLGYEPTKDFRPPYGAISPQGFWKTALAGYRCILWSIDSNDSKIDQQDILVERFLNIQLRAGAIILMHDDYQHTVSALPSILNIISKNGLTAAALSSLRGAKSGKP